LQEQGFKWRNYGKRDGRMTESLGECRIARKSVALRREIRPRPSRREDRSVVLYTASIIETPLRFVREVG
jgi:hypothetical protein